MSSISNRTKARSSITCSRVARWVKPRTGAKYEQWLDLFDRIGANDQDLLRRRVTEAEFPALTIIHVFDLAACRDAVPIIDALDEQISDQWTAVILFAPEITEAERAAVAAGAGGNTRVRVAGDLDQRFLSSNHIRPRPQVCRTKYG
jgi:hypothetical protein